jgi:hypothetical protein
MTCAIEEYQSAGRPITLEDISALDRPLVIRGLCKDWPIVTMAEESDTAFAMGLSSFDNGTPVDALLMAPAEGGVIGYNDNLDGFNYDHYRVSVTDCLKRLARYSRQHDAPGLAMQSAPIATCMPGFLQHHSLAFLDPGIQPRLWVGNRVTTPAHFDESHNIACVVSGVRRFTLFPPEQVRNLYVGPLDFAPTGAAISLARIDRPDDPRFPRLAQALAEARIAELLPGDGIYIPPLWWHHVVSLERINALVNYWWRPALVGGTAQESALGCLLHCILRFKSLPPAERAAWQVLLDHYVFGAEDPAAHIPGERRGVLGTLTSERVEEMRQAIRQHL